MPRARADCRHRIGYRQPAVVVAVDAHDERGELFRHNAYDRFRLVGEQPAVGVAQAQYARAARRRAFQCGQSVGGVGFIAVEKVFGVEYDFFAVFREETHAFFYHAKILVGRRLDDFRDVQNVALAEDRNVFCVRGEQGF